MFFQAAKIRASVICLEERPDTANTSAASDYAAGAIKDLKWSFEKYQVLFEHPATPKISLLWMAQMVKKGQEKDVLCDPIAFPMSPEDFEDYKRRIRVVYKLARENLRIIKSSGMHWLLLMKLASSTSMTGWWAINEESFWSRRINCHPINIWICAIPQ